MPVLGQKLPIFYVFSTPSEPIEPVEYSLELMSRKLTFRHFGDFARLPAARHNTEQRNKHVP